MAPSRAVVVMSTLLALSALHAVHALAAPKVCSAADVGKGFCLDCMTKARCYTVGAAPVPTSSCSILGEACTVLAGIPVCRPAAATACACNKASQCDAYNPDALYVCLSGGVRIVKTCESDQTCIAGSCNTKPKVETTPSPNDICASSHVEQGFVVVKPQCSSALYCIQGESLGSTECSPGQYFDVIEMSCVPSPPVPCSGCGTGVCPDKTDCSKWYICYDGVVLDEEYCSEDMPDFDIYTNECVDAGTGACTPNNGCELSSLTSWTYVESSTISSQIPEWCSSSPPLRCTCNCDP